jgi:hypothetical protein
MAPNLDSIDSLAPAIMHTSDTSSQPTIYQVGALALVNETLNLIRSSPIRPTITS